MAKRPKADAGLTRARKGEAAPVRQSDPRVQRLDARFVEARGQVHRFVVDSSRELGEVLQEGRALLDDPRSYNRWIASLDISRQSAANFSNVARFAREAPATYERWRGLGPSKIYRLARLPPRARDKVLATSGIEPMTDAKFAELCSPLEESTVAVTGNMLGNGLVQKALGMSSKLENWQIPDIDSPELKKRLKASLVKLAKLARDLAAKL